MLSLYNKTRVYYKRRNMLRYILLTLLSFFWSVLEIEAKEACDWLRATGFPQYAQLYEGEPRRPFDWLVD